MVDRLLVINFPVIGLGKAKGVGSVTRGSLRG